MTFAAKFRPGASEKGRILAKEAESDPQTFSGRTIWHPLLDGQH